MHKNPYPRSYSTRRTGEVLGGIQSGSLATALYRNGHYCGITPVKLPNGRLLWPADEVDALAAGVRAGEAPDLGARLAAGRREASARRAEAVVASALDGGTPAMYRASRRHTEDGYITPRLIGLIAATGLVVAGLAVVVGRAL